MCLLGLSVVLVLGAAGCKPLGLGYVGTDTCLACHNGKQAPDKREFIGGFHEALGCEECHGPGALHVRNGGRYALFVGDGGDTEALCEKCHPQTVADFRKSAHAQAGVLGCLECHDPHARQTTKRTYTDNQLCLQCHAYQGLGTEAAVREHTYHQYDPAGSGQSRCTLCHMVPEGRTNQDGGSHNHSLMPVRPIESNLAGTVPAPPNSCAGITGCHDGSIITSPVFDVDNPDTNERLQILYDTRYGS